MWIKLSESGIESEIDARIKSFYSDRIKLLAVSPFITGPAALLLSFLLFYPSKLFPNNKIPDLNTAILYVALIFAILQIALLFFAAFEFARFYILNLDQKRKLIHDYMISTSGMLCPNCHQVFGKKTATCKKCGSNTVASIDYKWQDDTSV